MIDPAEAAARNRWHAADDRLYPTLIANPEGYQRALTQIQAVVAELRRRGRDMGSLLSAEADPAGLLASAGVSGVTVPADLLVGVACSVRDRELTAERERQRVQQLITEARDEGRRWVTLRGELAPELLGDGQLVELHLATGIVLTAGIDPWSGGPPFTVGVTRPGAQESATSFADRDDWLAGYRGVRAEIESGAAARGTPSRSTSGSS